MFVICWRSFIFLLPLKLFEKMEICFKKFGGDEQQFTQEQAKNAYEALAMVLIRKSRENSCRMSRKIFVMLVFQIYKRVDIT